LAGTLQTLYGSGFPVNRVALNWTSDASGVVSGIKTDRLNGALARVVFVPAGAPDAPTDNYDVTLLDGAGVDVLAGRGADLDTATTTHVVPGVSLTDGTTTSVAPVQVDDQLELRVSGAGVSKRGSVILFLR
jgi:hypothetical protein